MRRGVKGLKASIGTTWPPAVRAHVRLHVSRCLGPMVGMEGPCEGEVALDHVRASHGLSMKSESIAVNAAPLCFRHHKEKTEHGKTWRPRLIDKIGELVRGCFACEREHIEFYGVPIARDCGHVDPVFGCCDRTAGDPLTLREVG